jgi:hypothetical protein
MREMRRKQATQVHSPLIEELKNKQKIFFLSNSMDMNYSETILVRISQLVLSFFGV